MNIDLVTFLDNDNNYVAKLNANVAAEIAAWALINPPTHIVTYGATANFDLSTGPSQKMTLTGDLAFTVSNPQDGQTYTFLFQQDETGNHTVTWPSTFKGMGSIGSAAGTAQASTIASIQVNYQAVSGSYYMVGVLNYGMAI
jgi:hypothetical protein